MHRHQVEFPKTHDIKRLLVLCGAVDADLAGAMADAAALTPYGVDYRYPGDYPAVSMQDGWGESRDRRPGRDERG